jgi:hypothetical protein
VAVKPEPAKRDQKGKAKAQAKPNNTKRDTKMLATFNDPDWLTEADTDDGGLKKNKGGRNTNPVLLLVSRLCRRVVKPGNALKFEVGGDAAMGMEKRKEKEEVTAVTKKWQKKGKDPNLRVRCIGSMGCKTTWATPRNQLHVFGPI